MPAQRSAPNSDGRLRADLLAGRRPDRPTLLSGRDARGQRRMLQFVVPGGANDDRAKQLLLRFEPCLHGRRWRARLLQRPGRQRPMPARQNASLSARRAPDRAMPVSDRLRSGRRRVLSCEPGDVVRGLLPVGRSAGRPEQDRVPADLPHPDRAALLAWEWSRNSLCDPWREAPSPACRGSWRPIATAASGRPSSPARAIVAPGSLTGEVRRKGGGTPRLTVKDPTLLEDLFRKSFRPRPIVLRGTFVARATAAIPP